MPLDVVSKANRSLSALERECLNYSAAVSLVVFARRQSDEWHKARDAAMKRGDINVPAFKTIYDEWVFTGARSAAMAAHDYKKIFDQVRSSINSFEPWRNVIGGRTLAKMLPALTAIFPTSLHSRDSVAHPELFVIEDHSFNEPSLGIELPDGGDGISYTLENCLFGDIFMSTFKGTVTECPLTYKAAHDLTELTSQVMNVCRQLEHTL